MNITELEKELRSDIKEIHTLMTGHIKDNVKYRKERKDEDEAFKKQFEPMLKIYNTSANLGRGLLWFSGIVIALGSAWLIVKQIFLK